MQLSSKPIQTHGNLLQQNSAHFVSNVSSTSSQFSFDSNITLIQISPCRTRSVSGTLCVKKNPVMQFGSLSRHVYLGLAGIYFYWSNLSHNIPYIDFNFPSVLPLQAMLLLKTIFSIAHAWSVSSKNKKVYNTLQKTRWHHSLVCEAAWPGQPNAPVQKCA